MAQIPIPPHLRHLNPQDAIQEMEARSALAAIAISPTALSSDTTNAFSWRLFSLAQRERFPQSNCDPFSRNARHAAAPVAGLQADVVEVHLRAFGLAKTMATFNTALPTQEGNDDGTS